MSQCVPWTDGFTAETLIPTGLHSACSPKHDVVANKEEKKSTMKQRKRTLKNTRRKKKE
jgi:hypothetical protein